MKNIIFILLFSPLVILSQTEKKETVYLLFDINSKEKCIIEDGDGNSSKLNKYRKEYRENKIYFFICDERFWFHETKGKKDTCSIKVLENLRIVNVDYINKKKSETILKYNPFKIYLIEKVSKFKIIKYEVRWIDEWSIID